MSGKPIDETKKQMLLEHLGECDACLSIADAGWSEQPEFQMANSIEIPSESTERAELFLMRRIDRSELGGQSLILATQGFLRSVIALLEPLLRLFKNKPPESQAPDSPSSGD